MNDKHAGLRSLKLREDSGGKPRVLCAGVSTRTAEEFTLLVRTCSTAADTMKKTNRVPMDTSCARVLMSTNSASTPAAQQQPRCRCWSARSRESHAPGTPGDACHCKDGHSGAVEVLARHGPAWPMQLYTWHHCQSDHPQSRRPGTCGAAGEDGRAHGGVAGGVNARKPGGQQLLAAQHHVDACLPQQRHQQRGHDACAHTPAQALMEVGRDTFTHCDAGCKAHQVRVFQPLRQWQVLSSA